MIRFIMSMTMVPIDRNETFEFTDWDDVDTFTQRVADRLALSDIAVKGSGRVGGLRAPDGVY